MNNTINIAEHFLSIQGEGFRAGCPSLFIRTAGCPLNCAFCDTVEVWKRGTQLAIVNAIYTLALTYYTYFKRSPRPNIVLTGGDPLMQQKALVSLLTGLEATLEEMLGKPIAFTVEVETEGIIRPSYAFNRLVSNYNVSLKLSNSGVEKAKRIKPAVVQWHAHGATNASFFKFVVGSREDFAEMLELCKELGIPHDLSLMVMPLASTREEMARVAPLVAELCIEHGIHYSPRLHIDIWDRKTGV